MSMLEDVEYYAERVRKNADALSDAVNDIDVEAYVYEYFLDNIGFDDIVTSMLTKLFASPAFFSFCRDTISSELSDQLQLYKDAAE